MTRFCKILATAGEWRHNVLLEYGLQPPVWNTTSNGSIGIGIIKLPKSSETKDVLGFCEYPYLTDQWLMIWLEKTNLYWLAVDCWTRSIRTNDYKCIQIGSAYFIYTYYNLFHHLPRKPSTLTVTRLPLADQGASAVFELSTWVGSPQPSHESDVECGSACWRCW